MNLIADEKTKSLRKSMCVYRQRLCIHWKKTKQKNSCSTGAVPWFCYLLLGCSPSTFPLLHPQMMISGERVRGTEGRVHRMKLKLLYKDGTYS